MQNKIFISYSRRELGFVDDLVGELEAKQYDVWLDYRVLIPGSPWAEQIDKGLKEADTVLLVVSKASLASEFVALEWRHFLETKKRVILLIFEAVDIPAELEKYEWVDFRGNYQAGLNELFSQLAHPIKEDHPVPETGFKAPTVVWATIVFSGFVAFLSLNVLWTIFIPFLLIPLPYQIYKRSFDFMRVQAALIVLPFTITLSYLVLGSSLYGQIFWLHFETSNTALANWLNALSSGLLLGVWGWILLAVLRSPAMVRWGRPESTPPKFKNPYKPNINAPEPTPFFIEHAFEDRVVAEELKSVLKKYGHPEAENVHDAKAVLVVISRFNAETNASPTQQVVFPVILQENADISSKLSKVQWIDFRPGVRGLDAIAQLLPNPRELLKALGMRPVSSLSVYPPMVTTLYYFILVLSVIFVGAILDYVFFTDILSILDPESYNLIVGGLVVGALLFGSLSFFMIRSLLTRTGLFSRSTLIFAGIVIQGFLMAGLTAIDSLVYQSALDAGIDIPPTFIAFGDLIFIGGMVMLGIVFTKNRLDLKRWFPSKSK